MGPGGDLGNCSAREAAIEMMIPAIKANPKPPIVIHNPISAL